MSARPNKLSTMLLVHTRKHAPQTQVRQTTTGKATHHMEQDH
jgi:hypothetical protein